MPLGSSRLWRFKIQTNNSAPRHLIDCESLKPDWIFKLFKDAADLKKQVILKNKPRRDLAGHHVGLLFYEPSTRTRASFHIASNFLGADPVALEIASSSVQKGETLEDTVATLEATGCHFLVVRHGEPGAALAASRTVRHAHVINGGDGIHQHPTQALLDAFTVLEKRRSLKELTVIYVGDVLHSRVARSGCIVFRKLGVKRILVSGPAHMMPNKDELRRLGATYVSDISEALAQADVINMLRIQRERLQGKFSMTARDYRDKYGLTLDRLRQVCKKDAIVCHQGPMNVGVEIDREVADSKNSVVLDQVQNGVAIRMAVLRALHQNCV